MKKFVLKMFFDHLIMILVTFIFTAIFGNFLNLEKLIWGYLFSGFTLALYGVLIYSDVTIFARKDFLNAKGDLTKIDRYLGFKACAIAQIPTAVFIIILYLTSALNNQIAVYVNIFVRAWLVMFLGFFPSNAGRYYLLYLVMSIIPIIVAGVSYYIGIARSKVYLRKN